MISSSLTPYFIVENIENIQKYVEKYNIEIQKMRLTKERWLAKNIANWYSS